MRLWHYKILPYLPKEQLIAQWRELNSIFKKQDNHILINYVYEYQKVNLFLYTHYVIAEMIKRNYKIKNFDNFKEYFAGVTFPSEKDVDDKINPFPQHHTNRYMHQCFFNLQEKYDRGQKGFTQKMYEELLNFICEEEY